MLSTAAVVVPPTVSEYLSVPGILSWPIFHVAQLVERGAWIVGSIPAGATHTKKRMHA